MPRGKVNNWSRYCRYEELRKLGVPVKLAQLARDWAHLPYECLVFKIRSEGVENAIKDIPAVYNT